MPSDMNVRSLISKFEQLTTEIRQTNFKSTEDLLEPRTPAAPKAATKFVYTPGQKSSYGRLADIEQKVERIHDQIVNLAKVTNEDFIRILFGLLNLLIDLGSIDTDGVQNLKQKKELCFKEITSCKEELLKCMGEQFGGEQKPDVPTNGEDVESSEESLENEIETPPSTFVSVAKLKNIWEKSAEDLRSRNIFRNSQSLSIESEMEGVVDAGYLRSNSDIDRNIEREVGNDLVTTKEIEDSDDEDDFHSLPPHELKSVKDMRSIFEGSNQDLQQNLTTSMKVYGEMDDLLERQKSLMNTLLEEVEYYNNVAKNEVVEENLVGLFLELNKFDTLNDPSLEEKKLNAIETVNSLQADFESKANSGENLKEDHDDDSVKQLNELCLEVDRYKELVDNLDPEDRVFVEVLEQNILEVLEQLDKLPVEADLGYKKIRAIRDLSALLSKVEAAREVDPYEVLVTAQEKLADYRTRVEEVDLSDKEAAHFLSNDIQVDLDKLREFGVAPEDEHRKNEIDKSYCEILFNLHKKEAGPYLAVCPPYIPSSEHNERNEVHQENDQANSDEQEAGPYLAVCPPYIPSSKHNERNEDHQENDQANSDELREENIPEDVNDVKDTNQDVLIEGNTADTTFDNLKLTIVPKDEQKNDHTKYEQIVEEKKEINDDKGTFQEKPANKNANTAAATFDQLYELTIAPKDQQNNDQTRLEQINEEKNDDTPGNQTVDTAFDQLYDELTIVPNQNGVNSKTVQNFDDLLKQEDAEESARIFDANATLDDIALKVSASQKVVETLSILDKEDTEKFRRNIEDVKRALCGQDTLGDAALELKKKSILENVEAIEEKLEVATNEVD